MIVIAQDEAVTALVDELARAIDRDVVQPSKAAGRPWALVGIRSRGDVIAQRIARKLQAPMLGTLDITLYRDDLASAAAPPRHVVQTTDIPFNVDGMDVVLVDDVAMTGRTARAAMQSLMDLGRPRRIWLSVLVDRARRELPISPDHVALKLEQVPPADRVEVRLRPADPTDTIVVRPTPTPVSARA